jgi:hypothetical protein
VAVSQDAELLTLLDTLPPHRRQPNTLFAVVRLRNGPIQEPAAFREFVVPQWSAVAAEMLTRATQTNEPGRCALLLPVLAELPQPIALIEVGASAGLCLYPDRYACRYGEHWLGDGDVVLHCTLVGLRPPTRRPEAVAPASAGGTGHGLVMGAIIRPVEIDQIKAALDDVFDHAIVFHGFTDYMRDYDVIVHVTAAPGTGIAARYLRYRFVYCVRATVASALPPEVWRRSLDDRLVDDQQRVDPDGYVWGVRWQDLYPGMALVPDSPDAKRWSQHVGIPFYEVAIRANAHTISLVFSDLVVDPVGTGYAPFVVPVDVS